MATSYSALQEQINGLATTMERGFAELKGLLTAYEARTRALEQAEAGCQPIITSRLDNQAKKQEQADASIQKIKEHIAAIEKQVQELQFSNKLLKWFFGIVGSAVLVYVVTAFIKLLGG